MTKPNKTSKILSFAFMLMFVFSALLVTSLQTAKAANIDTHIFIGLSVNPVGVGQEVTVNMYLAVPLETSSNSLTSDRAANFSLTIKDPAGKI